MVTLHYYDLVLLGVITPLLVALAVGYFTSISTLVVVAVLGGTSVAVMGYGLFVNGPVRDLDDLNDEVEDLPGPVDDFLK